jgi:hypothetical protein
VRREGSIELGDLLPLTEQCLDGYAEGLADAGWRGDPHLARIGFGVATALRYGPFGPFFTVLQHPELNAAIERATGHTVTENADCTAAVQRFGFDQLEVVRGDLAAF